MRKLGITAVTVALALLCGCTKEDIQPEFQMSEYKITLKTDNSAMVNISTSESGQTRASYDDMTDGQLNDDGIGIYCLPARVINSTATIIDWRNTIAASGDTPINGGRYWDNVKFVVGDPTYVGSDRYKLTMLDPTQVPYTHYPLVSDYGYDFYGYAPYRTSESIDTYSTSVRVRYEGLDGTMDIIHGKSKTPVETYDDTYYSARYFRKAESVSEVEMEFKHVLTKLNFFVKPRPSKITDKNSTDGSTVFSWDGVDALAVKSITLKNTINDIRLVIASNNPTTVSGSVEVVSEWTTTDFSLNKFGADNRLVPFDDGELMCDLAFDQDYKDAYETDEATVNPKRVGAYMLVVPGEQYTVEVILCKKDDPDFVYPKSTLTLRLPEKDGQPQNFKSGSEYNINISIDGPTEVNLISAKLIEWEEGEDVDVEYLGN